MDRAIELFEFWKRDAQMNGKQMQSKTPHTEAKESMGNFSALQAIIPGGVSQMPAELREAIDWAEAEKLKRGLA